MGVCRMVAPTAIESSSAPSGQRQQRVLHVEHGGEARGGLALHRSRDQRLTDAGGRVVARAARRLLDPHGAQASAGVLDLVGQPAREDAVGDDAE